MRRTHGGPRVLVTCEHAGNRVPARFADTFVGQEDALASHRGWDPGALGLARALATALEAPLRYSLTTRLLVDANRPLGSSTLFSNLSRTLPEASRRTILRAHHARHRQRVRRVLEPWIEAGSSVLHLGVHTFTAELDGTARDVDVGVLFDPSRSEESTFGARLGRELEARLPDLRIAPNQPYLGTDEGLTTELRARYPANLYMGIELEVSQALVGPGSSTRGELREKVCEALLAAVPQDV